MNVRGVWLGTDTGRTGMNYFTGGTYSFRDNHITLGQPLPSSNSVVIVEYETGVYSRFWGPDWPFFSVENVGAWYGTFLHEMAHGLGPHITFTDTTYIGDLYLRSDEIFHYCLMAGGNHNEWPTDPAIFPHWQAPAYLDAYAKYALGLIAPYELRYGENETNLVIYAAEEFPFTSRTKLVKVPLRPAGEWAYRRTDGFDYPGEEYLLLEVRKKGNVPGIYNFDMGLPHEGLLIYHVIEQDPWVIGRLGSIKIIDATPATPSDWFWSTNFPPRVTAQDSFYYTAVPFGRDSGLTEYVHGDFWQEIGNSNLPFYVQGLGSQAIYAKFRDRGTNQLAVYSASLTFSPGGADQNTNGLADSWEQQYFRSLNSAAGAPQADPDGDGMTNLQEYLAGTNPTNAASRLRITYNRNRAIEFPSVQGVSYVVEYTRDLTRGRWYRFYDGSPVPGSGTIMSVFDYYPPASPRFYRVRVPPK